MDCQVGWNGRQAGQTDNWWHSSNSSPPDSGRQISNPPRMSVS